MRARLVATNLGLPNMYRATAAGTAIKTARMIKACIYNVSCSPIVAT